MIGSWEEEDLGALWEELLFCGVGFLLLHVIIVRYTVLVRCGGAGGVRGRTDGQLG